MRDIRSAPVPRVGATTAPWIRCPMVMMTTTTTMMMVVVVVVGAAVMKTGTRHARSHAPSVSLLRTKSDASITPLDCACGNGCARRLAARK